MSGKGIKIKVKALPKNIQKVTLNGVLDGHTSYSFSQSLIGLLRGATRKVIIDCTDLWYISSAGIGVLIHANALLDEEYPDEPTGLVILNPGESVMDVFRILEIEDTFKFAATEVDAVKILSAIS
ncbi:MAG: STAS domain-containing protein [Planctomycetota bacterium]